ncbi:MAG: hypothetical protein GF388_08280, partial [Candidatus Aegiribacteria sp.]|nr:hypothetical protein [Candidatus Aegiribacteria sp.]MBD3295082.1 hypothetical protein [Candidatus Fermentibacteria bacterium]
TAVYPECISGADPSRTEGELLNGGFKPVACWPVIFRDSRGLEVHRVLREGYLNIEKRRWVESEFASPCSIMPDAGAFQTAFQGAAESLAANSSLFRAVDSQPQAGIAARTLRREDEERLCEVTRTELEKIYHGSPAAKRRVERELNAILSGGLAGYFLSFYDIVRYCRCHRIASSARGSAGGSIVAYLLGISILCPIQHGLSFSRFFNTLRSSPPDIDLDLDSSRRDQVIEWFLKREGINAAAVSQTVAHRARSAFRIAASALGISSRESDRLTGIIRYTDHAAWQRPAAAAALRASMLLRGLPSHLAPHPCGLVRSHEPVHGLVPLQPSAAEWDITQFDKDGVEQLGLLKMDLLGQRGLTTVSLVCSELKREPLNVFRKGGSIPPRARELLDSGRTIGVVHVESPAMRQLLRETRISTMEDVARALALVRPGAAAGGGRQAYLDRLHSKGRITCSLPELRSILRENLGVMLYQEDVSRAAEALLGLDEASSDLLRRRLKKGDAEKEEIVALCRKKCMSPERTEKVWEVLSGYAGYGFCKAHAFTYGAVACGAAALKASVPALYMASVMAAGGGFYGPRVYLEEARRMGIGFLPPGVNTGLWLSSERDGSIIAGFHHLRGMGAAEYEKLKRGRPYRYPSDVLQAGCGMSLCRNMAAAGCFREIGYPPSGAMMQLEAGDGGFLAGMDGGMDHLPDYSTETRVAMELGLLGLPLSLHPLALVARPDATVPLGEIDPEGEIRLWGRYVTGRSLSAGAGFMMMEDDTGVADVFLPSPLFRRAQTILVRSEATIILRGRFERGSRIRAMAVEAGPLSVSPLEPEPPQK